jgi:MFS family permease
MPTILACGDPFRNVGPMGWLLVYAFLAGFGISCILAIVNPILAATMNADWSRRRFHLGWAALYVLPGITFAVSVAAGWDFGGEAMMWCWLIYFLVLPLWTLIHFFVLLSVRRRLRRESQNASLIAATSTLA